ncbi:MAG: hypothetical protein AAGK21_14990, partial [Bacteroidota bacterium]
PVVYLDPYFLGDPLFVPGLARDLAARKRAVVLVHGSGEAGEQALESLGRMPTASDGVWDAPDAEAREAVERATRELNRQLAHELNEAGVPVVRVAGTDRGLLAAGDDVRVGRVGWLQTLVGQGVTVVVAALAMDGETVVEVDAARSVSLLAAALDLPPLALSNRSLSEDVTLDGLSNAVPDLAAVRRIASGGSIRVGPRALLRAPDGASLRHVTG